MSTQEINTHRHLNLTNLLSIDASETAWWQETWWKEACTLIHDFGYIYGNIHSCFWKQLLWKRLQCSLIYGKMQVFSLQTVLYIRVFAQRVSKSGFGFPNSFFSEYICDAPLQIIRKIWNYQKVFFSIMHFFHEHWQFTGLITRLLFVEIYLIWNYHLIEC